MRARRLGRRLVGLPLLLALVLVTTPALAALRSTTAPPSAQSVSSGEWRLVFHGSSAPPVHTTGTYTASQTTGTLFYLVNTGVTDVPASYSVVVTATSSNGNANVAFTACVGGTWTSNGTCPTTVTQPVASTGAATTRFTVGSVRPGSTALPTGAGGWVHVRVQNNGLLGLGGGTATLSMTVAPR